MTPSWQPILRSPSANGHHASGRTARLKRAERAVDTIAQALAEPADNPPTRASSYRDKALASPTLASGSAGVALFFHYLDRARPGQGWDELANRYLDLAIDGLGDWPLTAGLFTGFAGVGWVTDHLISPTSDHDETQASASETPPDEADDPCQPIDETLATLLERSDLAIGHDLFDGLSGWGLYALERSARKRVPGGNPARPRQGVLVDQVLDRILDHLTVNAHQLDSGIAWLSPASPGSNGQPAALREHFGLGLAHGVPGVCVFLARLQQAEPGSARAERARVLLESALSWIAAQKVDGLDQASGFPPAVCLEGEPIEGRPAWCSGEPGLAAALVASSFAAQSPRIRSQAHDLARRTALRGLPHLTPKTPTDRTAIVDTSLCHGSAGLAHLYSRLAWSFGDDAFHQAAIAWFDDTLERQLPAESSEEIESIGGFRTLVPRDGGAIEWRPEPGFLLGAAGVGLALISALYPIEPTWDRLLMLPSTSLRARTLGPTTDPVADRSIVDDPLDGDPSRLDSTRTAPVIGSS